MSDPEASLRQLPAVDALANRLTDTSLPHLQRVAIARAAIDQARLEMRDGGESDPYPIAMAMTAALARSRPQPVINATGVLLHTNLGRAPLSQAAVAAAAGAAGSYSNAELDLESGERGSRGSYTVRLLRLLTGAEDALIVNNNASAVLLALAALAHGLGVPVSRGELIEIGGSYRLPEVMAASGAHLIEVGTTNRTRVGDFTTALQVYECGAVLKVHPSNYEISGFVAEPGPTELVAAARSSGVPSVFDIGSGLLDETTPWLGEVPLWVSAEPGAKQAVAAGFDLVTFSGDKLVGGPQAGVILGTAALVGRLRSHPLARSLRVSAPIDAAMAATLEAYARNTVVEEIPFWRMAHATTESLRTRSEQYASVAGAAIVSLESVIGAGSAPGARLDSIGVKFEGRSDGFEALLRAERPILARRDQGDLVLDLRSIYPDDDEMVVAALRQCL